MFCESLAEFLKKNKSIRRLDISCNLIDDGNAATLKTSLRDNESIIDIDVRNNQLSEETEEEINEIITRNYLSSKSIPYKKLGDYGMGPGQATQAAAAQPASQAADGAKSPAPGDSPTKTDAGGEGNGDAGKGEEADA